MLLIVVTLIFHLQSVLTAVQQLILLSSFAVVLLLGQWGCLLPLQRRLFFCSSLFVSGITHIIYGWILTVCGLCRPWHKWAAVRFWDDLDPQLFIFICYAVLKLCPHYAVLFIVSWISDAGLQHNYWLYGLLHVTYPEGCIIPHASVCLLCPPLTRKWKDHTTLKLRGEER